MSVRKILFVSSPALALAMLFAVACGKGRPPGPPLLTTDAGPIKWQVWLEPDPPREKGNHLWLRVRDKAEKVVTGAVVQVGYDMPAMGSMAEMKGTGDVVDRGDGWYDVTLTVPMTGTWKVPVAVRKGSASGTAEYVLTVGAKGLRETSSSGGASAGEPPANASAQVPLLARPLTLPDTALESLRAAFEAYEEARLLLAADRLDGLPARAQRLSQALTAAGQAAGTEPGSDLARRLAEAAAAAQRLGAAKDLPAARESFGEVSRYMVALGGAEPRLASGWHVFACPMTRTFPKWMQRPADKGNPYLGKAMPTCGDATDWKVMAAAPTTQETTSATVQIDEAQRQQIGVRTALVEARPLAVPVRAVGKVVFDETKLADVSVKYRGWIQRLYVDSPGQSVRKGQPLFTLYSPELYASQQEYLTALASARAAKSTGAPDRADYLVAAARQRLLLWDLRPEQINRLARTGKLVEAVPILSTVSGVVVEKAVVAGAAIEPGMRLYRIAGLDTVWVEAEVYESELSLLHVGDNATVSFPYFPGRSFAGRIAFIYPFLDPTTRTGKVRVELANPGLELKPDMFANVTLTKSLGARLAVPQEAVLFTGERRFVFVDLGGGRLGPRQVTLGQQAGEWVEVLTGLAAGERIVTSGNFLVAAEARLKVPMEQWQ